VAARGIEQAEQELDGGGFAGAIRTEQTEDFAAAHLEIHVVNGAGLGAAPEILEDLGEAADGNDDLGGTRSAECGVRNGVGGGHDYSLNYNRAAVSRNMIARSDLDIFLLAISIMA
jgi:hypothetical protein